MRLVAVLAIVVLCAFAGQNVYPFRAVPLMLDRPNVTTEPNVQQANDDRPLDIYCYAGHNRTLVDTFRTVKVTVTSSTDEYDVYLGQDKFEVTLRRDRHRPHVFQRAWLSDKRDPTIQLDAFEPSCIGVVTTTSYSIQLDVNKIDTVRAVCFITGSLFVSFGGGYSLDQASFGIFQICILFLFDIMADGCDSTTCRTLVAIGMVITLVAGNGLELGEQFPPARVDSVTEMLARLLLIGVGSALVSFGVGNNAPLGKWVPDNVTPVR